MRRTAPISAAALTKPSAGEVIHQTDRLLTADEAAERLGTGVRFIRRLISERRIRYVKLGKYVRIPESVLTAFVEERTVEPVRVRRSHYGRAA